jgi:FtsP/CotA-like multicopper oxidase with cupredoxin domain
MKVPVAKKVGSEMKISGIEKRFKIGVIGLLAVALMLPSNATNAVSSNSSTSQKSGANLLAALPNAATAASVTIGNVDPYTPTTTVPDYFGTADPVSGYATGNFANSPLPISVLIQGAGTGAFYTAESDWNSTTKTGGHITRFIPINQGVGYGPGTIVSVIGGGGNGAQGTPHFGAAGEITSIDVFNPGVNYGSVSGIRKFVQDVPDLATATATSLPAVGTPNTPNYIPAADGYEIAVVRSKWKFSTDLDYTTVNMYVQVTPCGSANAISLKYPDGTAIKTKAGAQVCAVSTNSDPIAPFSYLGPTIVAQKDRPVRVTFDNYLPIGTQACTTSGGIITSSTGCGGDLFLPVDPTIMDAGAGPDGGFYSTNRIAPHLHGGVTPWISDGTMDQWVTPVGANEQYPVGTSVRYVPDMWFDSNGLPIDTCYGYTYCYYKSTSPQYVGSNSATVPAGYTLDATKASTNPGQGRMTFYYTNQQSARLMWYHDHSAGTTRLNVYSGEAAGYILHDAQEAALLSAAGVTSAEQQKVYVIQDKTFVPSTSQLLLQDPTWNTGAWGSTGSLWFPHVYQPNQNPALLPTPVTVTTANVATPSPVTSTTFTMTAVNGAVKPGQIIGGAGFADGTTVVAVSGTVVTFTPAATGNVSGLVSFTNASSASPGATPTGRWDYGPWFWPASTATMNGPVHNPRCTNAATPVCPPGENPTNPGVPTVSAVPEAFADTMLVNGIAYPVAHFKQQVYRLQLLNASNDRSLILNLYYAKSTAKFGDGSTNPNSKCTGSMWSSPTSMTPNCADQGEVSMLYPTPGPNGVQSAPGIAGLISPDQIQDHAAGVPDQRLAGPDLIEFSSEGGILPDLYTVPTTPVGYEFSRQSIVTGNVKQHGLILGPAQRAEVFIDLSNVPVGSTLILYNDGPAPFPGFDPRFDYYTGDADQTVNGGAPTTLPGYAPNTRTIMQIQVEAGGNQSAFNAGAVTTALHAAYLASQDAPVVPQIAYNAALNMNTTADQYPALADSSLTVPSTGIQSISVDPTKLGTETGVPTVSITGGNGNGARAVANVTSTSGVASVSVSTPVGTVYDGAQLANVTVTVSSPAAGGRKAVLVPSISGSDKLSGVALSNVGSGYTYAPSVTVNGASTTPAIAQSQLQPSAIAEIHLVSGGIYTKVPAVTIAGGGSLNTQTAQAVLKPSPISAIGVVTGGSYTTAPSLTISPSGSGATATAILSGAVQSVTVKDSGSCSISGAYDPNSTYFTVSFSGGGQTLSAFGMANIDLSGTAVALRSVTLLDGGSYTTAPTVTIAPHGFTCTTNPTATATISNSLHISSVQVTNAGSFTGDVTVTATPTTVGDAGGATFSVSLQPTPVASVVLTGSSVSDFTDAPLVDFDSGTAIATAYLIPTTVAHINVLDSGSGYVTAPTLTIAAPEALPDVVPGIPTAVLTTAVAAPIAATGNLTLTVADPGTGYVSAPTVTISGGTTVLGAPAATASASLGNGKVSSITVTNPGTGYLTAPAIKLIYPSGATNATAATPTMSTANVTLNFQSKGVQEAFEIMYGRMNAMMNSEIPATTWVNQTSVTWASVDSPTEVINTNSSELTKAGGTAVGTLPDGSQIWRFTHNGVDTHFLHFHMFNVQVVARMQWDGINQPLTGDDLGWRDTVSIDQLTVLFVAIRPIVPNVPWSLPNSIRPLSPSETLGVPGMMMSAADPLNNPVTQNNQLVNFGWEYMIHCHLLGHEENDMMRSIAVGVVLNAPTSVSASTSAVTAVVTGASAAAPVTGRCGRSTCTTTTITFTATNTFIARKTVSVTGLSTSAFNVSGSIQTVSATSFTVRVNGSVTAAPLTGANGTATVNQVLVRWTDASNNETGFTIQRSADNGATWSTVGTSQRTSPIWCLRAGTGFAYGASVATAQPSCTRSQAVVDAGVSTGAVSAFTDTGAVVGTYQYRVLAIDLIGTPNLGAFPTETLTSDPSNIAYVTL